jgi:hypothetical protein
MKGWNETVISSVYLQYMGARQMPPCRVYIYKICDYVLLFPMVLNARFMPPRRDAEIQFQLFVLFWLIFAPRSYPLSHFEQRRPLA